MRGTVPGLASPHPLGGTLPGLYVDDRLAQQLCQALDELLAPVFATLDCFPAYLDPATVPQDLLEWLAGWVGVAAHPDVSDERSRRLVAAAAQLYRWRGTPYAIKTIFELAAGRTPEIEEPGGTAWSQDPNGPLPSGSESEVVVRLRAADPGGEELRLAALLAAFVPAHVPWRLELLPG